MTVEFLHDAWLLETPSDVDGCKTTFKLLSSLVGYVNEHKDSNVQDLNELLVSEVLTRLNINISDSVHKIRNKHQVYYLIEYLSQLVSCSISIIGTDNPRR